MIMKKVYHNHKDLQTVNRSYLALSDESKEYREPTTVLAVDVYSHGQMPNKALG